METLWCNGQWMEESALPVSAADRGLTLGLGVFETLLAVRGRPLFVERHLERLGLTCARFGWPDPRVEFPTLPEIMSGLLDRRRLGACRARLRLTVTAGSGSAGNLAAGADRLVWLRAGPCEDPPAELSVMVSPWPRNERSAIAGLKCGSYAENVVALDHARRRGFDETLFFNTAGHLCEAAMANVFIVRDGLLMTPLLSSGCLPGITRQVVLESEGGVEAEISRDDLEAASEVFLTSATRGPVRIARIGDRMLPPGAFTGRAIKGWECAARPFFEERAGG